MAVLVHPFHISYCQTDIRPESHRLEIAIKLFTDDLEIGIQKELGTNPHLATAQQTADAEALVARFLKQHLVFSPDGKPVPLTFIGFETKMDVVWCYLESDQMPAFTTLKVKNDLLISQFEDQNNIVQLTLNGKTKGLTLNSGNTSGVIQRW